MAPTNDVFVAGLTGQLPPSRMIGQLEVPDAVEQLPQVADRATRRQLAERGLEASAATDGAV